MQPFVVRALEMEWEEFLQVTPITTIAIGLSFLHEKSLDLLHEWHRIAQQKLGFLSFIPEMAPFAVLVHRLKLAHLAKPLFPPYSKVPDKEGIFIWNHD